jgi:hypothetical protein
MFGCIFATNSGRCTKGIYGSIMKLEGNEDYDFLFIIDSEGLQSGEKNKNNEKNDIDFDRKIACFLLSVSHIVLIIVKGEINH